MAHYRCDTWGLEKSLEFYVSFFLKSFKNNNNDYLSARVVAYSNVGLILIYSKPLKEKNGSFYVANPVSRECVEILFPDTLPLGFETIQECPTIGIVTRTGDKGVVLSYKVVLMDERQRETSFTFLIYSSETGLWSLTTYHLPYSLILRGYRLAISLNENLHWLSWNSLVGGRVVVSIDFYDGSDRCRVTPFPDSDKTTKFERACTASQGFLMYMNIVSEDKLCLWRLQSDGWQLISAISPVALISTGLDCPVTMNPFDGKTAYFYSKEQEGLLSINLHNGKFVLHNQLEHSRDDGRIIVSVKGPGLMDYFKKSDCSSFVLPQWLHRIPNTMTRV
ncbi:unnamed protein product [Microthlaspi erraticum]|uniref:F-box protein At3g26010-like beta-propeller domain-containing protein n=1 Tax=Microthlaspi erraticum TaxID=1685480 RepID=A0A6D2KCA1_9BRAS|nr:unnamed protein product [Microthlaspi erraticum]